MFCKESRKKAQGFKIQGSIAFLLKQDLDLRYVI